jgi:hypothetical protein
MSRQITGDDIVSELIRNLHQGQFRIRYTTLVPGIYRIYLHEDDFEEIRPALPYLVAEAERALDEAVQELNRRAQPSLLGRQLGLGGKDLMEYKSLSGGFEIEFHPDQNGELTRGDIEIHSELGPAPRPEFGLGEMTRLITKRASNGGSTSRQDPAPLPTVAPPAPGSNIFARICFEDRSGRHTFEVTRNQVVVGRGGKTYWVDLKLDTEPDVSREHCRLRRDPESGRFFLKDLSQFGTSLDGKPVPGSLERAGGADRDRNIEVELPRRARIGLADIVFLDFEALS